jgi:hypothetical protein
LCFDDDDMSSMRRRRRRAAAAAAAAAGAGGFLLPNNWEVTTNSIFHSHLSCAIAKTISSPLM